MTAVFYPGAGTDASFLGLAEFADVQRFILCDTAPNQEFSCICCKAPPDTVDGLRAELTSAFGVPPTTELRNKFIFCLPDGRVVEYYFGMNCLGMALPKRCHLYLCGLWYDSEKFETAFQACTNDPTRISLPTILVHPPSRCLCGPRPRRCRWV